MVVSTFLEKSLKRPHYYINQKNLGGTENILLNKNKNKSGEIII